MLTSATATTMPTAVTTSPDPVANSFQIGAR